MTRKFYKTRFEAEKKRRKGERIYHEPGGGYYIRRPYTKRRKLTKQEKGKIMKLTQESRVMAKKMAERTKQKLEETHKKWKVRADKDAKRARRWW